jgi:hypothetical protein
MYVKILACWAGAILGFGAAALPAGPPLLLSKSMSPAIVHPGDTVTICLSVTQTATTPEADIMWVLDITGSMGGSIGLLQANITAFTNQLAAQGIDYRQGLYVFSDSTLYPAGYVLPDTNDGFATSDAQFLGWVNTARASTGGGGDWPEDSLDALAAAAAGNIWRPAASHTLIVVSDAPAHAQGFDNLSPLSLTAEAVSLHGQGYTVDAISSSSAEMAPDAAVFGLAAVLPYGDLSYMPPLAGGQWLDITSPGTAWNAFLSGLGSAVASYTNVVLTDPLPPQLAPIVSGSEGATITGNTLSWSVSSLGSGTGFSHCILAKVKPGFYGAIDNTASVSADGTSPTSSSAVPVVYVTYTPSRTPSPTLTVSPTITPTFTVSPTRTATPIPLLLTPHYPNPDPTGPAGVWLPYTLSTNAKMDFKVFDVSGELVRHLDAAPPRQGPGTHEQHWDLSNDAGRTVSSGVYLCKIRAVSDLGDDVYVWERFAVLR